MDDWTTVEDVRVQARFVVVDPWRILTDAQVVIRGGRIAEIHEMARRQADVNLSQSVLLPGLINAHTHLEFSDLARPFPAGDSFPQWIASVIRHRLAMAQSLTADELISNRRRAIQQGLAECWRGGTVLLADIVTEPWSPESLAGPAEQQAEVVVGSLPSAGPGVVVLPEVLGLEAGRLEHSLDWALATHNQEKHKRTDHDWPVGLSPHAPYSLRHPVAIDRLMVDCPDTLLAMHVAESLEERQWLETGSGPFRELYDSLGLPTDGPRMQIAEALDLLAARQHSLLIHGNYLTEGELDRVASSSTAIVYCPRTHRHFRHRSYPLQSIVSRHIPLLLATDSRATNPDLNLWRECLTARQLHPSWPASEILAAVTIRPARILGVDVQLGTLDIGRRGYLNVMSAPAGATAENLLEQLLSPGLGDQPQPLADVLGRQAANRRSGDS